MKKMSRIYLAGNGWGVESAKKGLLPYFNEVIIVSEEEKETINSLSGETIVFDGYKPIVPHNVIVNNVCINVHYSLLPKYRGLHSTVWAILNDEDYLGLSIHLMNDNIDDGAIIHQKRYKNDRVKTSREYIETYNDYVANNLGEILKNFIFGKTQLKENNKKDATWVGRRNHQDCKVDFNKELRYLNCFFRALVDPYPLPYVEYKDEEFSITKVDFHYINVLTHIGRILNIDSDGLWVKAKDGYLIIKELRDSNNNIVPLDRFRIGQYFNH